MTSFTDTTQDYATELQRSDGNGVLGLNSDILGGMPVKGSSNAALTGPLVWSGADYQGDQAYTLRLSEEEAAEINSALASFKSQI
jgi:hypothetical protein